MTIMQPFSSRVVVTVRPFSSVWEDIARALPVLPLDEEEDDADTDERADPDRDCTLTELVPPEASALVEDEAPSDDMDLISRPSFRIRVTLQSPPETPICPALPGPAVEAAEMTMRKAGASRNMGGTPKAEEARPR